MQHSALCPAAWRDTEVLSNSVLGEAECAAGQGTEGLKGVANAFEQKLPERVTGLSCQRALLRALYEQRNILHLGTDAWVGTRRWQSHRLR